MKFYDIKDSIIEIDGYILKFTNKGVVGKATPKNRFNAHIPDNDNQIQHNLNTTIRLMKEKDEVYADMMVTCTRIGEPQKALMIEISKKSVEEVKVIENPNADAPVRRGRKSSAENTGDSNGQDR